MPMYDLRCPVCRVVRVDVFARVSEPIACFGCGVPMERLWTMKPPNVIGDECDQVIENNGTKHAIRFRSKSAMRDHMAAHGLTPMVRHVPEPGSDKSPHTTNWAGMDPQTLANATELVSRAGRGGRDDESAPSFPIEMTIRVLPTGIRGKYEDA